MRTRLQWHVLHGRQKNATAMTYVNVAPKIGINVQDLYRYKFNNYYLHKSGLLSRGCLHRVGQEK